MRVAALRSFDAAQDRPERSRGADAWPAAFARSASACLAIAFAEAGGFARFRCDDCGLDRLVPFSCKGRAVCASCGPSTRREPQGRREPGRTAAMLRAVPSNVEGRRATDGGTRRAPGRPRVPGGAGAAVGADAAASAALPAGVGSRPLSRGGPSTLREPQGRREPGRTATMLRAIPSKVEGWSVSRFGRSSASCGMWPAWLGCRTGAAEPSRSFSASAGR